MSGIEEAAALEAIIAAYPEMAGAVAGGAELGGVGAGASGAAAAGWGSLLGGAGAAAGAGSGLTAADYATLAASNPEVYGGAEAGLLGADAVDTAGAEGLGDASWASQYDTPYGAGDTVTNSITSQPGQGPGMYEDLKYRGMNALNKAGGAFNKLPGPIQGMVAKQAMSGLMPEQQQFTPAGPARMPSQGQAPPPTSSTYGQAPYQAQNFASSYGGQSMQGMSPEMLELLKRLRMQQGGM